MESEIREKYGNRVRMRVCGLCWDDDRLLLVNHKFLTQGDFWAPPGGGIEFGQSAQDALIREFQEEAGITVEPGKLMFVCEFVKRPLHALELFFEVVQKDGKVLTGTDPESSSDMQIIKEVRYVDFSAIMTIPPDERHGIFRFVKSSEDLRKLSGFYRL